MLGQCDGFLTNDDSKDVVQCFKVSSTISVLQLVDVEDADAVVAALDKIATEFTLKDVFCEDRFDNDDLLVAGDTQEECEAVAKVLTDASAEFTKCSNIPPVNIECVYNVLSVDTNSCPAPPVL